jgi:uridine kinase
MTILRDHTTSRGDFIFYADRLSTLIVEKALELIPHRPKEITTPLNLTFEGVTQTEDVSLGHEFVLQSRWLIQQALVGISILRSGGPFSYGLRRVIRDVQIGAMLIQSDPKTGEPLLLSSDLPQCVKCSEESKNVRVLLMDSQVSCLVPSP